MTKPKSKNTLEAAFTIGALKAKGAKFLGWRKIRGQRVMEGSFEDGTKVYVTPDSVFTN